MSSEIEILKRRLEREIRARKDAESILEKRTLELFDANEQLININQNLEQEIQRRTSLYSVKERIHSHVIENLPDIVYKTDANGNITFVNKVAVEKIGYSEKEFLEKNYIDFVRKDYKIKILNFYNYKLQKKLKKSTLEFPIITKNGDEIWLSPNVQFFYDEEGNLNETISIARNVTETKYINEQLKRSEEKYRSIIENLDLGLLETDTSGVITKAYPKFLELTGYYEEELVGKDAKEVLVNSKAEREHVEKQEQLRRQGIVSAYEAAIYKKNGEKIWVIISAAPIFNREGKVTGTIGVHFDISRRKKTEEELQKARKEAEDARNAEQLFLANMSHEIRTPLNAVIGMAHLLYDLSSTPEQIEYLNILQNSANLLKGLINDILDISKIEAGKLEYNETVFDIKETLSSLQKTFELKVQGRDLKVVSKCDKEIEKMLVKGDNLLLNQIFLNLLGNAEKFTEKGTIGIDAYILKQEEKKVKIQFWVYDTGIGIDESKLPLIFEKYEQANQDTKMKYGGTGLGLAITKKIVNFLGGDITVESQAHKGSTFKVTLTFLKADEKQSFNEITKHKLDKNAVYNNILVVEDNAMNRKYLQEVFKNYKITVDFAYDGQIAVNKCLAEKYDLIFMDLQMPVKDGFDATVEIRLNSNPNFNTPIVALSAYATEEVINKCKLAGMDDFISKPVTPSQLKEILNLNSSNKKDQETQKIDDTSELDLDVLEELYFGDESYAFEMFDHFLKDIDDQIESLDIAVKVKNWKEARRLIHKIKPGFSMVGVPSLQEMGSVLETACELEDENEITKLTKNLFVELEIKMHAVKNEHARLKSKLG